MATLIVSPRLLEWAADRAGETVRSLADDMAPQNRREQFLAGAITLSQAEKIAARARIPFGFLFLPEPPEGLETEALPDLRQRVNAEPLSADFYDVLRDVRRKQDWYREYLASIGAEPVEFVGRYPLSRDPAVRSPSVHEVAEDIRKRLDLGSMDLAALNTAEAFFSSLSDRAEDVGVLVFRSGIVRSNTRRGLSEHEFRGFAIADPVAPVVFINGKDWPSAWAFTLIHELAHLWIGESGVSDVYPPAEGRIERYCNAVAAEVLVPESKFLQAWAQTPSVEAVARQFKVSQLVAARRALDAGMIDIGDYDDLEQKAMAAVEAWKAKQKGGGGNPYFTIPVRNSKRLTKLIVGQAMTGQTLLREAASLLNVKPSTVLNLAQKGPNSVG